MIERYSRSEMTKIFSLENKYAIWLEIEVLACEAMSQPQSMSQLRDSAERDRPDSGISEDEARWIRAHAAFDVEDIAALEASTHHDVIAFLTNLGQNIDAEVPADSPKPSRWLHYGMTSSDLGDTALSYQVTQALDLVLAGVRRLGESCKRRALEHKDTLCVGRTHGIHAEPMTIGLKFGAWAWALKRAETRLDTARGLSAARGAISGAVGTYSSIDPAVEAYVCEHLGLVPDPLSTQVIARDNHAHVAAALAGCAATLEQMATEVRALQKTDMLEAEEPFMEGQKGSSAMPHKRNPIVSERICGLARVIKANAQVALDNVALWHERDISHSSAERVALADSFIALDYILDKMRWVVDGLVVYPQNCLANLSRTRGLIYSSKVLLALINAGLTREQAYSLVQRKAMQVWQDIQLSRSGPNFQELLAADKDLPLSAEQLDALFDPRGFLQNMPVLFERLEELKFG